jgi:SAM-dependent methyltransferase
MTAPIARENARRVYDQQRLCWYGEPAEPEYWATYFAKNITSSYYQSARKLNLQEHELGQVLIEELHKEGKHLEAGCGLGYWVAALRQHGFDVVGIDYSESLVAKIRQIEPRLPVRFGNALAIDCPDEAFDGYLSFGVVEHRLEGPEPFLKEAYRVVKPGGKLILTVPGFGPLRQLKARLGAYRDDIHGCEFFQYGFTQTELLGLIEQAGFRPTLAKYIYLDRLLQEEIPGYRRITHYSHLRPLRRMILAPFSGLDGHMLLIVGEK